MVLGMYRQPQQVVSIGVSKVEVVNILPYSPIVHLP